MLYGGLPHQHPRVEVVELLKGGVARELSLREIAQD